MKIFISHNKADTEYARAVASSLEVLGAETWFDEWQIAPGQSIVGGIEAGLSSADVFMLLWSENAAASKWVGTEWRAYLNRRVSDDTLRVVPLLVDESALPTLIQDYRGLPFRSLGDASLIAARVMGAKPSQLGDALMRVLDFIEAQGQRARPERLFAIGDLDAYLGRPSSGTTIVVAGRQSVGRTSLLMSMLVNGVLNVEGRGIFISLDSSERITTLRILANESQINIGQLMTGRIRTESWSAIGAAVTRLASSYIEVTSPGMASLELVGEAIRSSPTILELAEQTRSSQNIISDDHLVPLVFIDDLQVLPDNADIADGLKRLATIHRCCIVASIRTSFSTATDPAGWQALQSRADCIVELAGETDTLISVDVSKNRHGATGWFLAELDGACSKVTTHQEPPAEGT